MSPAAILVQLLNGLAQASSLFLVAAGLSLIFGVTRIVNFAHGSLYMLGIYIAYTLLQHWGHGPVGFWLCLLLAAAAVALLGAAIEILVLRRVYAVAEMFQLLATFALVLIINDAALWIWGPDDLLGPLAPGLNGALKIHDRYLPVYDLALLAIGPAVLLCLWLLLTRTRWGTLLRAATQDREMLGALGVNQAWLFTGVFALGSFLAALGGALQIPRQPASLGLDLSVIGDVFVVVVAGGMGSIPGAYLAAVLVSLARALCVSLGTVAIAGVDIAFPKLTLVIEFVVMAAVLVWRPWGLLGRPLAAVRAAGLPEPALRAPGAGFWLSMLLLAVVLAALPLGAGRMPYAPVLALDVIVSILFAASLHFMMGPGGMPSFGHAAYFGLGAYGAALLFKTAGWPMGATIVAAPVLAALGALVFGWFCVRLSGVYLAMLTLAFAQIVWSVAYQWDDFTGGSNGLLGIWPAAWLSRNGYYYLALALAALALLALWRMVYSPFGQALRAVRDNPLRAEALGIDARRVQWVAFVIAGAFAGLAGALYVYSKGSVSPEIMGVGKSVDGLVMVLLGGIQALAGPIAGAAAYKVLQDYLAGATQYWHAWFGAAILFLVLAFPRGIAGAFSRAPRRAAGSHAP